MNNDVSKRIVVAVTGASGSVYARVLFNKLSLLVTNSDEVAVVFTRNAEKVWEYELGDDSYKKLPFKWYQQDDFNAPFVSGSSFFSSMVVIPCSMGMLGRIAHGISDDIITRGADVMLKERRTLILVPRETPLNLIHIENMRLVTLAGGIICPAMPSFYSKPADITAAVSTVVDRVLQLAGFSVDTFRWQ
jgi:4-hydroxy-3-polyprenylbenzoate decarboxylase